MATGKKTINQAHGLTSDELADVQLSQIAGEEMNTASGSGDKQYKFPPHEKHLIHAQIQSGGFNPSTGEPTGSKYVQKFDPKEFERMQREQAFAGLNVTVLHDPTGEAEDSEALDYLAPMIVSQPFAGTILTEDLNQQDEKKLKKIAEEAFGKDEVKGLKKADIIAKIEEQIGFAEPEVQETLMNQWNNRFAAQEFRVPVRK